MVEGRGSRVEGRGSRVESRGSRVEGRGSRRESAGHLLGGDALDDLVLHAVVVLVVLPRLVDQVVDVGRREEDDIVRVGVLEARHEADLPYWGSNRMRPPRIGQQ
eukprot:4031746-Prymnesium_polylepis.1